MTDSLSAESIAEGLETHLIGNRIIYLPETGSTNETARQEALNGAPDGTVVIASRQTSGRGRLKRSWMTPEGNIALSIILYPKKEALTSLVMAASLSVFHTIEKITGLQPQIKWPNDVLINGLKVCGILVESDVRPETVKYTVTGIGINVNIGREDLADVLTPATSLAIETGGEVSRLKLIQQLLREMDARYADLRPGGPVFREWRDRLITLGTDVQVTSVNEKFEGIAETVDADGCLLVRDTTGTLRKVMAGEVTLRRS